MSVGGGALAFVMLVQAALPLVSIAQGPTSHVLEPREVVVRTPAAWQALWKEHSADPLPAPDVDFAQFMVVGVFLGTRPTAGFSVEITAVAPEGGVPVVEYREERPAPGDITAQVLTSPFHLVRVPLAAGDVEFRRQP